MSPEHQFGAAVRRARENRDWSQEELARQLASSAGLQVGGQSGIARIERGERPTRLNEALAIAEFLGIELGAFMPWQPIRIENTEWMRQQIDSLRAVVEERERQADEAQVAAAMASADLQRATGRLHGARGQLQTLEFALEEAIRAEATLIKQQEALRNFGLGQDREKSDGDR